MSKLKEVLCLQSEDDTTTRAFMVMEDEHHVHSARIDLANKTIFCLSSQVGCNGQCIMCRAGSLGPAERNVAVGEYITQLGYLRKDDPYTDYTKCLISFMGQGEPLDNFDNLIRFYKSHKGLYPQAKYAMATIANNLEQLKYILNETEIKVLISLHASTDETRKKVIPTAVNSIKDIINTVRGKNVEFNYVLLKGINDDEKELLGLGDVLPDGSTIKLNCFNEWDGCLVESVTEEERTDIADKLIYMGFNVELYNTNGVDICAGCGQM